MVHLSSKSGYQRTLFQNQPSITFLFTQSVSIVSRYFYLVLYFLHTVCSLDSILICLLSLPLTDLKHNLPCSGRRQQETAIF